MRKKKLDKLEREFRDFMKGYSHFTPEMVESSVKSYMSAFTNKSLKPQIISNPNRKKGSAS